jgi:hypothetical protein
MLTLRSSLGAGENRPVAHINGIKGNKRRVGKRGSLYKAMRELSSQNRGIRALKKKQEQ